MPHRSWFRIGLPALVCLTLLSLGIVVGRTQNRTRRVTWQYEMSSDVELGIRDKLGDLGRYTAVFVVTAPDGEQHKATRQVVESDMGYILFPDDFKTDWDRDGKYKWQCRVDGKVVSEGAFEYKSTPSGRRLIIAD
jgi:hypothetical protein